MVDSRNRELMAELYRLMERYECPPVISGADRLDKLKRYLDPLIDEVAQIVAKYSGNEFAYRLATGLYNAVDQRLAEVNPWFERGRGNDDA